MENQNPETNNKVNEFIQVYPPIRTNNDLSDNKKYLALFSKGFKRNYLLIPPIQLSEIKRGSNIRRKSLIGNEEKNFKNAKIKSIKDIKRKSVINTSLNLEDENIKEKEKEKNKIKNKNIEYNCFLIEKDIQLRNNKSKRTGDIKIALENFLRKSDLIEEIKKFFEELRENSLKKENKLNVKDNQIEENPKNKEENEKFMNSYIESIITKLAENVVIEKYKKNEFVVKMNEIGENCYFLVSGELSILKPVEYHIEMTYDDYLIYLSNLLKYNEYELISALRNINQNIIDVGIIEELKNFIRTYFILKFNKDIIKLVDNNTFDASYIENRLKLFNFTFEDFNLSKENVLNHIKSIIQKSSLRQRDLKQYLNKIITPTQEDYDRIDSDSYILKENKNKFTIFRYEDFLFLKPGCFFGETALDIRTHKRNASIRVEEDAIILSLKNKMYQDLLSENNKKLKSFDVLFICNNFFFKDISPIIFTRRYFSLFKLIQYRKNDIIFKQSDKLSSVYFVKEGNVKLEIYASIIDIFNLIEYYYNTLCNNSNLKINQNIIKEMKEYTEDENITDLRHQSFILKELFKKKRKFELYISNSFDNLGLEEFFLNNDYISTCEVISTDAKIFEISKDSLNSIITNEKQINNAYYKLIEKKLISLIKRLHVIKINHINQLKYKIKQNFFGTEVPPSQIIKGQTGEKKAFSSSFKKNPQPKLINHYNYTIDKEEIKNKDLKFMEKTNLKFYSRNNNFENYDLNSIFKKSTEKLTYENSIKNKYSSEKNNKKLKMIYNYCYKSNQNIEKMQKNNNKTELTFKYNIDNNKKKNALIKMELEKEKMIMETTIIKVGKEHLSLKEIGKRMKNNRNNSNTELCIIKNNYSTKSDNMKKSYFSYSSDKKNIKNNKEIKSNRNYNILKKININVEPIKFNDIMLITSKNKDKLNSNRLPRVTIQNNINFLNLITCNSINNYNKYKIKNQKKNIIFKSTKLLNKNHIGDNYRTYFDAKNKLNSILASKTNFLSKEESYSNIMKK